MASREGRSNPLLWLLIGIVAGVAGTVSLYLFLTRPDAPPPEAAAPSIRMEAPAMPADPPPEPVVEAPLEAPSAPAAAPAPRPPPSSDQIAEDAAATGMTGPAEPQQDTAVN